MNRFFINSEIESNKIEIIGEDAHHIKNVLRLNVHDSVICIKNKKEFLCNIDKIEKNSIILIVQENLPERNTENAFQLTLMQGLPKGDKFEFIIEKSVESGVNEIIPLKLKRSIAKISEKDEPKKYERFHKIAKAAAQQSHRLMIPEVTAPKTIKQLDFSLYDIKLLCYEDEGKQTLKQVLNRVENPRNIAIVIGPEGGIDAEEAHYLLENGFISVSLGCRILRCETAGVYTLANINYHFNK